ncbi:MAG: hypothetical protein ABIP17_05210, partial [Ilumatobacteraceae bacterium]
AAIGTVGAVVTLVGTFLPWLRSGARGRSSYTIFELVDRLGFAPDGVVSASLRVWPVVPLLLVVAVVGFWVPPTSGLTRWVGVGTVAVAVLWVGGTGVAVLLAPADGLLRIGPGPIVTIVGAVVLAAGAAVRLRESAASAAS